MSGNMTTLRTCVVCKNENEPTASICPQCGSRLQISGTVSLSSRATRAAVQKLRNGVVTLESGTIALYLPGTFVPLVVLVQGEVILGRNVGNPNIPIVDLTPYSAGLLGVSRHHAVIRPFGTGYSVEDLGSTNGTWVNTGQLTPGRPQPLDDNDAIRLGELVLHVRVTSD